MLLPTSAKGHTAKKFFDFAMSYEMNDMHDNGVSGVRVKVFGTSMDTPGRAELIGMEGHMAYTSCCVCKHCFSPPIPPRTKCCFDGYRRFLVPVEHLKFKTLSIFFIQFGEIRLKSLIPILIHKIRDRNWQKDTHLHTFTNIQ